MNWEKCRIDSVLLKEFLNEGKIEAVYWPGDNSPVLLIKRNDGKVVSVVPYSGYDSFGTKKTDPGFMFMFFDNKEHYNKHFSSKKDTVSK